MSCHVFWFSRNCGTWPSLIRFGSGPFNGQADLQRQMGDVLWFAQREISSNKTLTHTHTHARDHPSLTVAFLSGTTCGSCNWGVFAEEKQRSRTTGFGQKVVLLLHFRLGAMGFVSMYRWTLPCRIPPKSRQRPRTAYLLGCTPYQLDCLRHVLQAVDECVKGAVGPPGNGNRRHGRVGLSALPFRWKINALLGMPVEGGVLG